MRPTALVLVPLLLAAACTHGSSGDADSDPPSGSVAEFSFPPAPAVPAGPVKPEVARALALLTPSLAAGSLDLDALETVAASEDPRLAWFVSDLLRFVGGGLEEGALVDAFQRLTGVDAAADPAFATSPWKSVTDHLIVWDLPALAGYRELKAELFLLVEPRWQPFLDDADSDIDWRLVSWGGVLIDDRTEGDPDPCAVGCIPALDDPSLTAADAGDWYPDDAIVFGVEVGGDAVALPKNIMEVHEMVNITIGGRRLGIPYCTLCGSAQAYFTDSVPGGVVLRTSGLLSRSNKVTYDLNTLSVVDTFTGRALSGPLQDAGVVLEQTTVVASTWGEWKQAHPSTRIVAEDGGIGRSYPADPLGVRDDDGPIFPIGSADPRLPVQALVVGVIAHDGTTIAFPVEDALAAIGAGDPIEAGGITLVRDGGGFRARSRDGTEMPAHQAFWFAWSQFHPETILWSPP